MDEVIDQVRITQRFGVSPEAVFDAWINPAIMRRWMFSLQDFEIVHIDVDARPAGRFFIRNRNKADGREFGHFGGYREIDRPYRLVFSLAVPKHFSGVSSVTVDIRLAPYGCTLTLTQTGVDPEITGQAWRDMLAKLADVLS